MRVIEIAANLALGTPWMDVIARRLCLLGKAPSSRLCSQVRQPAEQCKYMLLIELQLWLLYQTILVRSSFCLLVGAIGVDKWTATYVILIESGNYTEQVSNLSHQPLTPIPIPYLTQTQVNVTRRGPTYLLGQTAHPKNQSYNTVNIIWAAIAVTGLDNAFTSTLTIAPNLNASLTGSGTTGFAVPAGTPFGCIDFRTYNLNFINDFAPYSDNPSLALSISYANGGFYYTGFYSYQDTVRPSPPLHPRPLADRK